MKAYTLMPLLLLTGCASNGAHCERHLTPINPVSPAVTTVSSTAAAVGTHVSATKAVAAPSASQTVRP